MLGVSGSLVWSVESSGRDEGEMRLNKLGMLGTGYSEREKLG
ncbi:hypothetical protein COLO4_36317 [Corchorus olitorius]|uniref:Uncharacterized protein n=1 Tax=Corchorus olitorius TaxID=93759 RepID=A0A1R3G9W9_9ROSI|nr:hypothetical protein COLO4_36317 [Corchorus olitorius]